MSTSVIIVLIILLVLAILVVPFAREMIKDREELHSNPIQQKFSVLAQALSDGLMDGKGEVTVFDDNPKLMNLMSEDMRNLLINFAYSTGNLTLTLNYKYFHNELVHNELYTGLRNADRFKQIEIAKQFILICKKLIANHQQKVTGSAAVTMPKSSDDMNTIQVGNDDIVAEMYSKYSHLQKVSVLILLYRIARNGEIEEQKILNDSAFTLMQLQLKTRWDECKDHISSLDIYQQLKAAGNSLIDMVIMSAMQMITNLGAATDPTGKLTIVFFDEFGKLGYTPKDIDNLLRKIDLLYKQFGDTDCTSTISSTEGGHDSEKNQSDGSQVEPIESDSVVEQNLPSKEYAIPILFYKIGKTAGFDEESLKDTNSFCEILLDSGIFWDMCKPYINAPNLYDTLKSISQLDMSINMIFALKMIGELVEKDSTKEEVLIQAFYSEFERIGYSKEKTDIMIQTTMMMGGQ